MANLNINIVILGGRLTREPTIREIPNGNKVASAGLVINKKFKKGAEYKTKATFVEINAWGTMGENLCKYMHKGSEIIVHGEIDYDEWTDKDTGKKRTKNPVTAYKIEFMGSKKPKDQGEEDAARPLMDKDVPF